MRSHNNIAMHSCHIEEALGKRGLRKTADRHRILELFEETRTWTASEIAKRVRGADLSTVYRNLQTLCAEALIVATHSHDGEARYEAAGRPHHDHVTCAKCDTLSCIPCPVPKLPTHNLELAGVCDSCR